mmetsp:Transcript_7860/g.34670  ORF Transcript_7860/g.34670 Transcript_7860/m.34670 type:complete len:362 (+) Transcript_7860:839-1924(+)
MADLASLHLVRPRPVPVAVVHVPVRVERATVLRPQRGAAKDARGRFLVPPVRRGETHRSTRQRRERLRGVRSDGARQTVAGDTNRRGGGSPPGPAFDVPRRGVRVAVVRVPAASGGRLLAKEIRCGFAVVIVVGQQRSPRARTPRLAQRERCGDAESRARRDDTGAPGRSEGRSGRREATTGAEYPRRPRLLRGEEVLDHGGSRGANRAPPTATPPRHHDAGMIEKQRVDVRPEHQLVRVRRRYRGRRRGNVATTRGRRATTGFGRRGVIVAVDAAAGAKRRAEPGARRGGGAAGPRLDVAPAHRREHGTRRPEIVAAVQRAAHRVEGERPRTFMRVVDRVERLGVGRDDPEPPRRRRGGR